MDQQEAFQEADFVYVKNWSSYVNYGEVAPSDGSWTITKEHMALTNQAKFMHCLPIRRNVVAMDEVIDESIVIEQASNRLYAAQAVLTKLMLDL